jgi:hypothetical protein
MLLGHRFELHPFLGSGCNDSRTYSRYVALLIKAIEKGVLPT